MEVVMLERYFVRPDTIDRIRASWIGEGIERYVAWLTQEAYSPRCVCRRVPLLMKFGEFARTQGAATWSDLPQHVQPFASLWTREHGRCCRTERARMKVTDEATNPVEQMLGLMLPGYLGGGRRRRPLPFAATVPGFFPYLREERGLRDPSVNLYERGLRCLENYLSGVGLHDLAQLSAPVIAAFVTESSRTLGRSSMISLCSELRVFLRYLHRERLLARQLAPAVKAPQVYRLADVPRSISWEEVRLMLEAVDRRTVLGRRDYAMLLLLVTYGLRAREVAALTLDDVDWKRERLRVPERKAGHSTAYPLSGIVGEAILAYLQDGRPKTEDRHLFFRVIAPRRPLTWITVADRATHYLKKAGVVVARPGSHTLRHTCVARLLEAEFSFKTIGDYVGHRSAASTAVYTKVALETLRQVALGDGEDLL
jgi:integrase/recombinase XerD